MRIGRSQRAGMHIRLSCSRWHLSFFYAVHQLILTGNPLITFGPWAANFAIAPSTLTLVSAFTEMFGAPIVSEVPALMVSVVPAFISIAAGLSTRIPEGFIVILLLFWSMISIFVPCSSNVILFPAGVSIFIVLVLSLILICILLRVVNPFSSFASWA